MSTTLMRVLAGLAAVLVLAVAAWKGLRIYLRRYLRAAMDQMASFQVTVLEASEGVTRVRLRLAGSDRPMRLVSLSAPRDGARSLGLKPPAGFLEDEGARSGDEAGGREIEWRPLAPMEVVPGEPVELELRWNPTADQVVRVFGRAEAGPEAGGAAAAFAVLAGPRPALEVRASNLRSAIFTRARERNTVPRSLPEWNELQEIEARLAAGDENGAHPTA